jgi:DNA-binding helix-hairpin-helix protein with protein kinase domain
VLVDVGTELRVDATGEVLRVERLIGEGSQGSVFVASPTTGGDAVAVKWYFPHTATTAQRAAIDALIDRGAPSRRFLWPEATIIVPAETTFGYVMPLRPDRFAGLAELLTGKVDVPFSAICRLCLELANAFLQLHSEGLCYRDISFSNVFFDPTDGLPLICDNDNVGIDGRAPVSVLGTRRFMAPEIVRHEAVPSSTTDLYSLAVLLFYILMAGHPLVGRREQAYACWDETAEGELFGTDPLFVFDPDDDSNRPDPSAHGPVLRYWDLYPEFVRTQFTQAFTRGLRDPANGRVRESVWRATAARLLDSVQRCATCRKENFYDEGHPGRRCWFCDRVLPPPAMLVVERSRIVISDGARIRRHHLVHDYDLDTPVGTVVPHPNRPELVGLRNDTTDQWWAWLPSGTSQVVDQGRSIRLEPGTRIDLGRGVNVLVEAAAGT